MGILEELAGAAAAVVADKKLNPDASLLQEGIAAVVGFKGVEALEGHFENKDENQNNDSNA